MKNILKKLCMPLFIGFLILITACNKDKDDKPEQIVLLKKVFWSDANQSSESVYEYDNQNRLITRTDNNNGAISVNTFSYNSSGKLSERVRSENGVESLRILYTFTNSLITFIIQSKIDGQWVDGPKTEYSLDASGKIIKMQGFYKVAGQYQSDSYQTQIWGGDNIVKQETWGIDGNKINSITLDLDNKNNPYIKLGIINGLNGYFKNNLKKQTIMNQANEILFSFTNSYEYNKYNYPSKSWRSKTNDEEITNPTVTIYEYDVR